MLRAELPGYCCDISHNTGKAPLLHVAQRQLNDKRGAAAAAPPAWGCSRAPRARPAACGRAATRSPGKGSRHGRVPRAWLRAPAIT